MVNKLPSKYECPLDVWLLAFIDTHLNTYHKLHFTPNMITTISIVCGMASAYMVVLQQFPLAAFLFGLAYYFDCVDGKLARKFNQITVFGDYYDHFGDIFKFILLLYVLYVSNPHLFTNVIGWILLLYAGMMLHLGCQEKIYEKKQTGQSPFFKIFKSLIPKHIDPRKCIQYTRYIGCGTFYFILCFILFFWEPTHTRTTETFKNEDA